MADVVQKSIEANDINNGGTAVNTVGRGTFAKTISEDTQPDLSEIEAKLTGRLDDRTYYTT
jgi:hypothetical protein